MAAIASVPLPIGPSIEGTSAHPVERTFKQLAATTTSWLDERGLAVRDAIVLLPFAQLLPLARKAFGNGWLPRIETTQTLAAALGPPFEGDASDAGAPCFDTAIDQLVAAGMLADLPWGQAWRRRQPRAFDSAVAALVATAHALARRAFCVAPTRRQAWWDVAREHIGAEAARGPGERESMLARVALEWAALAAPPPTDRLFDLQPSAWVYLQAGGRDALSLELLAQSSAPGLIVDVDREPGQSLVAWRNLPPSAPAPQLALCRDFEDEAQAAAAQVLAHLVAGETPVALVANDRAVTRRIHALLARQAVPLADETGWRLSTTRAGAAVMAWQRAARADASTDDVLDALTDTAPPALPALDRELRRLGAARRRQVDPSGFEPACAALWRSTQAALESFAAEPAQPLRAWVDALDTLLRRVGARSALDADVAGRQLLAALGLDARSESWPTARLSLDAFVAWVDASLEQASFVAPAAEQAPLVVITPMARALLRPFAGLVMPACDHRHLGALPADTSLLGDALAQRIGLPTRRDRLADQRSAFWHALRCPRVTLLRRAHDGDEPLAASPLLERLALDWRRDPGGDLPPWRDARQSRAVAALPVPRPAPAPWRLPQRLSASQVEALRACPYRFFSRSVLRLSAQDELDDAVEKSDFGSWLHAVLHRFHRERELKEPGPTRDHDVAALRAAGTAEREALGLGGAAFWPFAASFEGFVERYVDWQRERDAAGHRWRDGELVLHLAPAQLGGIELHGRIDRLDDTADRALMLVDYKTASTTRLAERVKAPLEDTQLAFYAALLPSQAPRRAIYLALDHPREIVIHEHKDVAASAQALLDGLGDELERLRHGATLPALGEGRECDWCEARGLCRRDDWSGEAPA